MAILAGALLLGPGCANLVVGHPIDRAKLVELIPGRTTRDDVTAWFGTPLHTVNGAGGDVFVYRFLDGKGGTQELVVSFNGDVVAVASYE